MGCVDSRVETEEDPSMIQKISKNFQFEVYASIKDNKIDTLRMLLMKKFDINYKMPTFNKRTALHVAAEFGQAEIIIFLCDFGAKIDELDSSGSPPLFYAMRKGYLDIVKYLLEKGADPLIVTNHNLSFHDFINHHKIKESHILLKKIGYNKIKLD